MKHLNSHSAFTLVEMVISLTVFSIFITMVLFSYMRVHTVFLDLADARSLNSQAQIFMQDLINRLKTEPVTIEGSTLRFEEGNYTWNSLDETLSWQGATGEAESVFSTPVKVHDFSVLFLSDGRTSGFPALISVNLDLGRPARSRPEVHIHLKTALTPRYAIPKP